MTIEVSPVERLDERITFTVGLLYPDESGLEWSFAYMSHAGRDGGPVVEIMDGVSGTEVRIPMHMVPWLQTCLTKAQAAEEVRHAETH